MKAYQDESLVRWTRVVATGLMLGGILAAALMLVGCAAGETPNSATLINSILGNEEVTNALVQIGGGFLTIILSYVALLVRKAVHDQQKADKMSEVFKAAVWHTYETYVRERKDGTGRLRWGDEEKAEALSRAKEMAIGLAQREGFDLVAAIGREAITRKIENTVQRMKTGASS